MSKTSDFVRIFSKRHVRADLAVGMTYVGRPSRYGNPFKVGRDGTQAEVVSKFALWLEAPEQATLRDRVRRELAGKSLICWCAPFGGLKPDAPEQICHAQVLARIANGAVE